MFEVNSVGFIKSLKFFFLSNFQKIVAFFLVAQLVISALGNPAPDCPPSGHGNIGYQYPVPDVKFNIGQSIESVSVTPGYKSYSEGASVGPTYSSYTSSPGFSAHSSGEAVKFGYKSYQPSVTYAKSQEFSYSDQSPAAKYATVVPSGIKVQSAYVAAPG